MPVTFPGESPEYRAVRDRLLAREIELRREMEAVAVTRRELPPGGAVPEDYVFQGTGPDGQEVDVRLSELFALGKDSLAVYNMMFHHAFDDVRPGEADGACPSCTALLDQLDGAVVHLEPHVNFAVVAKAPLRRVLAHADRRGWRRLRMLSSAANTFNADYHGETADGDQMPMLHVFHRDRDTIRHFWSSELLYADPVPGQDPRHVGTIEPVWNIFDLTPEGRGPDWDEQLEYP